MARLLGLGVIVPVALLLTLSFFVLLAVRKAEGLKGFGYVVASLLWASALLVLSGGIYTLSTGKCPIIVGMHQMKMKMCCPMMGMMKPDMMPEMMPGEGPMMKKGGMGCMKQGKADEPALKR